MKISIEPPGPENPVYRPSELNREARIHLEAGFPRLWVSGEISNLSRPGSGHLYFTLKDDSAQLRCALFRNRATGLAFRPENGREVLVRGRLSLYEARGDYQLIADGMLEAGSGALQQAFERLKRKLEAEGLFAAERKISLPAYPRRIGVVTSPTGAAIRDILEMLRQRWPIARVRIYPAQVQGEQAPASLERALKAADRHGFADVLILARGGGSMEDLWAFNDEKLARTITGLKTPVVTGIGHETDFTIADFVADLRATTPTAAAQAVTPDGPALLKLIRRLDQRLKRVIESLLLQYSQRLDYVSQRIITRHPARRLDELDERLRQLLMRLTRSMTTQAHLNTTRLGGLRARLAACHPRRNAANAARILDQERARLVRAVQIQLERKASGFSQTCRALNAVSPLAVLGRGYALVRDPGGNVLSHEKDFTKDTNINILIRDFKVNAKVLSEPEKSSLTRP